MEVTQKLARLDRSGRFNHSRDDLEQSAVMQIGRTLYAEKPSAGRSITPSSRLSVGHVGPKVCPIRSVSKTATFRV